MNKMFFYEKGKILAEIDIKEEGIISIGRNSQNNVVFSESTISSRHAELMVKKGSIFIIDLNSKNGIYIDGVRLKPNVLTKLSLGENITFASKENNFSLRFREEVKNEKQSSIIIGRSSDCNIVLDSLMVSRRHTSLKKIAPNQYELEDLNSTNGTFYKGKKIQKVIISSDEEFIIDKFIFKTDASYKRIDSRTVVKLQEVSKIFSNEKMVIKPLSFEIYPRTINAIMGPSGCGKSTLLKMMNGMISNTTGQVAIFDLSLSHYYNYFKSQIGYVPQDDIVHLELTVYQSIYYAAKLRLENVSEDEIEKKINSLLEKLKIRHIKDHKNSEISGGQRKRVCIAIELLSEPMLLLLDEPTSPLDPQSIKSFMSILQNLVVEGTTIVMVTHKPEDLQFMDEVIFLTENGHLAFKGKTNRYLDHFRVKTTVDVYDQLSGDNSKKWILSTSHQNLSIREEKNIDKQTKSNWFHQTYWLTKRNIQIKTNDKLNLLITILEAPLIGFLIGFIFKELSLGVLFMMVISSIWFGINNAAREIVKEQSVFIRERLFNLYTGSYLFSKLLTLISIALVQSFLFVGIILWMYSASSNPLISFWVVVLWLWFVNVASASLGLLISAAMKTSDKVLALVPILLIPQLMLAGVITTIHSRFIELLSYITFSRWGTEGLAYIQKTVSHEDSEFELDAVELLNNHYHSSYSNFLSDQNSIVFQDGIMILGLGLLTVMVTYYLLYKKI